MAKLTKRDIVVAISNQTGMVQHQVFDIVQRTLDKITDSLANNVPVELRNFGIFQPRLTKPRVGRNPNQPGSSFVILPRATVKFKAGKIMRQRVEKLSRQLKETVERNTKTAAGVPNGQLESAASFSPQPPNCSREQSLDRFFQALKINWLGDVFREACLSGLAYILFATNAAERYSRQILLETHFTHQFVTAAVRQSDVADEQIEILTVNLFDCLFSGMGQRNFVAVALQHSFHSNASVMMIVHQQYPPVP